MMEDFIILEDENQPGTYRVEFCWDSISPELIRQTHASSRIFSRKEDAEAYFRKMLSRPQTISARIELVQGIKYAQRKRQE